MVRGSRRTEKNQSLKLYTNIAVHFGEQIENTETYEKYWDVYLRKEDNHNNYIVWKSVYTANVIRKEQGAERSVLQTNEQDEEKTIKLAAHIM